MGFEAKDDIIGTDLNDKGPSAADSLAAWREKFENPGVSLN